MPVLLGVALGLYFFLSKRGHDSNIASMALSLLKKFKSLKRDLPRSNVAHYPQSIFDQETLAAMSVLGIIDISDPTELTEELVLSAHRKAISDNHPDRGGDVKIATKINLARDHLIFQINRPN